MYKIFFSARALSTIDSYVEAYSDYYEILYSDSGIWSEDQIIASYTSEANYRYDEILETITHQLARSHISYPNNIVIIRWRSKILLVSFVDEGNTRIITGLEIR